MFTNYSQTYAAGLTALAGVIITLGKVFGWEFAENDVIFALGTVANLVGIVWGLIHRKSKGDISPLGKRL